MGEMADVLVICFITPLLSFLATGNGDVTIVYFITLSLPFLPWGNETIRAFILEP